MFITRDEARIQSLVYYFTGEECSKGHIADRLVSSNACVDCVAERNQNFLEDKGERTASKIESKELRNQQRKEKLIEIETYKSDPNFLVYRNEDQFEDLVFLPKTREEAENILSVHYFTGNPCKRGHLSKRYTKTGSCVTCESAWDRRSRFLNPDAVRASRQNRRALKFSAGGKHTAKELNQMFKDQCGLCKACGQDLNVDGYHADHIMPLILFGRNDIGNIQLLCPSCNTEKGAMHPDKWFAIVEKKRLIKLLEEGEYEPVYLL